MDLDRPRAIVAARAWIRSGTAREARERAGLTQADLAEAIGVSKSAVCLWEQGKRQPRGDAAVRWAQFLNEIDTSGRVEQNAA